ncbi:GATL10 [Symbiodinium natans]|uniref:GATL10 protein n=1 Tax=Symbiodinium natans TaxID=878477 RepID=A0A812KEB4_9DINO|nr:GATL10 [Symbiodinium natans]
MPARTKAQPRRFQLYLVRLAGFLTLVLMVMVTCIHTVNMIDQGSFQPSSREGEATVHSEAYAKSWEDSNHSQHRLEKWAEEELSPPTFQPSSTVKEPEIFETTSPQVPKTTSRKAPHVVPAASTKVTKVKNMGSPDRVHICFCSDDADLRPLAVAINSTMQYASRSEQLTFHVVTAEEKVATVERALIEILPPLQAQLVMHSNATLQAHIKSLISYRKSSGARKGLASPFNFAPFYLEEFLASWAGTAVPNRLVYMDSDVVLQADVTLLAKLDMGGYPVAAVEDCSQHFDLYIDFDELSDLGLKRAGLEPAECVFNRGVFVMDVQRWKKLQITQEIERWMARYREAKKDLYKFGLSQPPWLLALHDRYSHLSEKWNCRGLGRETLSLKELKELKADLKMDFKALQKAGLRPAGDQVQPYLASCSADAKLLHFNGKLKPWQADKWASRQRAPICLVHGQTLPQLQRKEVSGKTFVRCADLWSYFLSPEAENLLVRAAAAK